MVAPDGTIHVDLVEYAFVGPTEFPVGTELTLTNVGDLDHDLSVEGVDGAVAALVPGASSTMTLDVTGRFEWYCSLHPRDMRRTITVT